MAIAYKSGVRVSIVVQPHENGTIDGDNNPIDFRATQPSQPLDAASNSVANSSAHALNHDEIRTHDSGRYPAEKPLPQIYGWITAVGKQERGLCIFRTSKDLTLKDREQLSVYRTDADGTSPRCIGKLYVYAVYQARDANRVLGYCDTAPRVGDLVRLQSDDAIR